MAANPLPPIPPDKIEENYKWRDWFNKLGTYIQQVQFGNIVLGIFQGGTGGTSISEARFNLNVPAKPTGSAILAGDGAGEFANVTVGTGLSYTGGTLTNTSPDQTVTIASGTGISTSGTYPNFTVTNTSPDQTVSITGAGGSVVTGSYPNFTVTSPAAPSGVSATIITAKLTTGGANGSMTFTNGILTAQTPAT